MIFNIPHASHHIPENERAGLLLNEQELRTELLRVTDWYTDVIFGSAAGEDDVVVQFPVSRLVLDPERFEEDAVEAMSARGVGVIYLKSSIGGFLRHPVPEEARQRLLDTYYRPHHRKLADGVCDEIAGQGQSLIVDCHSFPSVPLHYDLDQSLNRPDICIGTDPFHTPTSFLNAAVDAFSVLGYAVEINRPYCGCIVPNSFYLRGRRVSSIMIEINRKLYMNETTGEKTEAFERIGVGITEVLELLRAELHKSGKLRKGVKTCLTH